MSYFNKDSSTCYNFFKKDENSGGNLTIPPPKGTGVPLSERFKIAKQNQNQPLLEAINNGVPVITIPDLQNGNPQPKNGGQDLYEHFKSLDSGPKKSDMIIDVITETLLDKANLLLLKSRLMGPRTSPKKRLGQGNATRVIRSRGHFPAQHNQRANDGKITKLNPFLAKGSPSNVKSQKDEVVSKNDLDSQLDAYMAKSKKVQRSSLDDELEEYMREARKARQTSQSGAPNKITENLTNDTTKKLDDDTDLDYLVIDEDVKMNEL